MLKAYFAYYRPYKLTALGVILGSMLVAMMDLLFPYLVRHVMSEELPQGQLENLFSWLGLLLLLYCGDFLLMCLVNYYGRVMSASIENDMRRALFTHLENMSFTFFDNSKKGQLLSRLIGDIVEISELTFRGLNDVMTCSITMVGTILIMLWMNPLLAGVICFLLIFKTIHTVIINSRMKRAFRANRSRSGEVAAQADEALSGIRLVKAFAREHLELERFMEKSDALFRSRKASYRIFAYYTSSVTFFTHLTNLVLLGCGALLIARGKLTLSDFVAFLLYVNIFMKPLFRLTIFTEMYQKGMAGFHRLVVLRAQSALVVVHTHALQLQGLTIQIEAGVLVEADIAETEVGIVGIHHSAVHLDLRADHIHIGVGGAPQLRRGRGSQFRRNGSDSTGIHGNSLGADSALGLFHIALFIEGVGQDHVGSGVTAIADGGLDVHLVVGGGLFIQIGGGNVGAIQVHMDLFGGGQLHITVNAAAGIPAAGGGLVIDLDSDHVLLAELDVVGDIKGEGGVAIGVAAQLLAIDIDGGVHVHTIEVDADLLVPECLIQSEGLAIPADTTGEVCTLGLHGLRVVLLNAVVMGKVHTLPAGGIKFRPLCTGRLAQIELPVVVEVHGAETACAIAADIDDLS